MTRILSGFNSTQEETEAALGLLKQKTWSTLRTKIDEQTSDTTMLVKLKLAFEERFRYDDDGVPRIWRAGDDIDALFRKAKEETLAFIPLYAKIQPQDPSLLPDIPMAVDSLSTEDNDFDFDASLNVLSSSKMETLASSFRREADAYYVEAKRSLVSSISQVPAWIYAVMAVLGWNEFIVSKGFSIILRKTTKFVHAGCAAKPFILYDASTSGRHSICHLHIGHGRSSPKDGSSSV